MIWVYLERSPIISFLYVHVHMDEDVWSTRQKWFDKERYDAWKYLRITTLDVVNDKENHQKYLQAYTKRLTQRGEQ